MIDKIFLNLHVKNLDKTMHFFSKIGFAFDPRFNDQNSACMIVNENIYVMLLDEKYFKEFIPNKEITNTSKNAEVIISLAVESRQDVESLMEKVLGAGGKIYREKADHGWMYERSFQDINGHIWEIFFMDESKMPDEMKNKANI